MSAGAALALHTGVLALAPHGEGQDTSSAPIVAAMDIIAITIADPPSEAAASTSASSSAAPQPQTQEKPQAPSSAPAASSVLRAIAVSMGERHEDSATEASGSSESAPDIASASSPLASQDKGGPGATGTGIRPSASGPRLLARGNPCAGYFPASASSPAGKVRVTVEVTEGGTVSNSEILAATPPNSGFSQAAIACASRLRFAPARTEQGRLVRGRTTLLLSFTRD